MLEIRMTEPGILDFERGRTILRHVARLNRVLVPTAYIARGMRSFTCTLRERLDSEFERR